jgi:hypothetical protein
MRTMMMITGLVPPLARYAPGYTGVIKSAIVYRKKI